MKERRNDRCEDKDGKTKKERETEEMKERGESKNL